VKNAMPATGIGLSSDVRCREFALAQVFYHQPTPRFGPGQSQHTFNAESLGIA